MTGPILHPTFGEPTIPMGPDQPSFSGPKSWPMLFNLTDDIGEQVNIAPQNPEIVNELMNKLAAYTERLVEPQQWDSPYQGPQYFCKDCPKADNLGNPDKPSIPWL